MSASALATLSPERRAQVSELFQGLLTSLPIENFVRITEVRHRQAPLGFSGGPSRFSPLQRDPGQNPLFGIIYIAEDLATGLHETLIRDRFDLNPSRILMPTDYSNRVAVNISTPSEQTATLLDLTDGNAVRYGVPADVIRYSVHTDSQHFSEFVYANMPTVDGILYRSRLTERFCIAIYDRSLGKFVVGPSHLLSRSLLVRELASWNMRVS